MDIRWVANMIATDLHFKLRNKTIDKIDIAAVRKAIAEECKKDRRLLLCDGDALEYQVTRAIVEKVG